jgi:hypothetical protein
MAQAAKSNSEFPNARFYLNLAEQRLFLLGIVDK